MIHKPNLQKVSHITLILALVKPWLIWLKHKCVYISQIHKLYIHQVAYEIWSEKYCSWEDEQVSGEIYLFKIQNVHLEGKYLNTAGWK